MNYRHAYHAGNFGDCVKHALLVWILEALGRKAAPFFVLDTHAGVGRYDLGSAEAQRTGEWKEGVARLMPSPPAVLARYVALVEACGSHYPGSPWIARQMLRAGDRLACCELHPEDGRALRRLFRGDKQVGVHARDGYEAVRALLPPGERRGLVLIDPPYEAEGEFERVLEALVAGAGRFGHGVYAVWYPIKHRSPVTGFYEAVRLAGLRDVVAAEFLLREPVDPTRLNGCGVLVRNAPFGFEAAAAAVLAAIGERLGAAESGVVRVTGE